MNFLFRSKRRIRREAANWVARLGGGAGEGDHAAFRAWYEADRRNAEAYDRMAAIWSASGQLGTAATVPASRAASGRRGFVYALAASILAVAALAFLLRGGMQESGGTAAAFATARAEMRETALPDGSRIVLDAESRVELAFSARERRLVLRQGRARFTVAHEARPFIVQAGDDQVVATGTVFDVSLLDRRLSVVLLEGSIEVRRARAGRAPSVRQLAAGQRLTVSGEDEDVAEASRQGDIAWASRMLQFDGMPLGEAVALVNRYSRAQVVLGDRSLAGLRVSGAFRTGDAEGFASSIAAAFGLRVSARPNGDLLLLPGDAQRR